jgi:guanylate kinase
MVDRGEFLEWAEVYGHCYGTSRRVVEELLMSGRDVLLELDVQGARHIKEQFPGALLIFIRPPSLQELSARIAHRGTETEETIRRRLDSAPTELREGKSYDYEVVNDRPESALGELLKIIRDAKSRGSRRMPRIQQG